MNRLNLFQRSSQRIVERYQGARIFVRRLLGGIAIVCSCVWVFGCSSPPEPASGSSKQDIQSDADRFFEKMERDKQGKPDPQP